MCVRLGYVTETNWPRGTGKTPYRDYIKGLCQSGQSSSFRMRLNTKLHCWRFTSSIVYDFLGKMILKPNDYSWVRKAWRSRANVWVGGYFCCFLNWPQSFIYSLGLLSDEPVLQQKTPLDTLCLYLTKKLAYGRKTFSLLVAFISWSDKKLAFFFRFCFPYCYIYNQRLFFFTHHKSQFSIQG